MESKRVFFVAHFDPTGKEDLKQGGVGDCWFLSVTCRHCASSVIGCHFWVFILSSGRVKQLTQYYILQYYIIRLQML